ncbi:HNH endonuclease [Metabacillus endolithicus]|uniref:HNH endonuclease n=1 Tax=Metabacillus endolithicus TaxID=1535204 RepID=A0ABW5BY98_9BACI
MKRDIQINYGILDQIIEQLHTYKNALNQMHSSLTSIAVYVESNAGKSLDVWDETIQQSKKNINSYQAQIDDLLSLFENYVTDTTAYITPISRNSMMRVDRNDIWWNLTQIESGVNNNMFNAILETHKSPSFLFGLFDDPTPEEIERSRHNKQQLDAIRTNIESSKAMLEKNIEGLWDLYETKVKKFENVDDEYSTKASAVKDTYTNFFEGVSDVVSVTVEGVWNFIKGLFVAIYEIAEGLISLVIDAGIIAISSKIPDSIEPEFLKKAANTRVETFAGTLEQIIDDPIIVLESVAQSISDTSEKEGIMYVTGGAATSLIPYVGQSKYLKLLKVEKDKANNTKAVNPAISQKVKEIVQNNKVFEGIKKETVELYKDVKKGGTQFVDDVTNFLGRTLFPNQSLQMSTANSVPVNVFSRSTVEDRIDSVVSRSSVKVDKGRGNNNIQNIDEIKFENAMVEAARNQPPYTRKPNIPRNFISKVRNEDGTTTFTFLSKKNGKEYNVRYDKQGFPIFDSKHEITLPEKLHLDTDAAQFEYLSKMLYKEIKEKPELLSKFTDREIELLKAGKVPQTLTWHHHQEPGKMQIVDYFEHQAASHTGGRAIWGGGEAGRKGEIKKQILELSSWD